MRLATVEKIAGDLRLNPDAARVVFFVAGCGKGEHPIPFSKFSQILAHAGEKKVRTAVSSAVENGWVERRKGGWGSPDSYSFIDITDTAPVAATANAPDPAKTAATGTFVSPPQEQPQAPDPAKTAATVAKNAPDPAISAGSVVVVVEEVVDVSNPPVVPPQHSVDLRVDAALDGDEWDGCRNAIRDYFRSRVTDSRQWGYLMSVKTWMDGSPTSPTGFGKLQPDEQRQMIAAALNEFLSESEKQERDYRSSRGQTGMIRALHTKVEYSISRRASKQQAAARAPALSGTQQPDPEAPHGRDRFGRPRTPFPEELET